MRMSISAGTSETTTPRQRARRGLWLFALLLLPFSLLGYWFYYVNQKSGWPILPSLPLMLSPAVAATITRLALGESFADVAFRWGGERTVRAIGIGVMTPLLVGSLAYGVAYGLGLAHFAPPTGLVPALGPVANFALLIILNGALGTLVLLPGSAGEEIGWRGYLLPRLIEAGVRQPIVLSGLIWDVWHLPPLWLVGYARGPYPWLSAFTLLVATLAFGTILAWLRLDTGSIWPAVISHAAWNAIINGGFHLATTGEATNLWVGESGVLVVLALLAVMVGIGAVGRQWINR